MPRSLRLAAALCAAAALLHSAPAHASAGMELALQDDNVFVGQHGMARDKALSLAAKLHTKRIRVNLLWARTLVAGAGSRTAPAHPVYDFTAVDQLQQEAALRGIKLQLTLTGPAPAWATGEPPRRHLLARTRPLRAVRPHRGRALQGPRRPLLHLERAELGHLARARQPLARHLPQPLRRRLQGDQAADPRAQVLFGELAPQRRRRTRSRR